jgi:hypothetical protein
MFNWFDLMRQAQGGAGFDNMARQFGLTPDQTQRAVAALMPAFMMAFQRSAMNPNTMMQLFQTMAGGHYPNFFESATQAFSPQGRQEGKVILDQLFGSDEVSRRVAHQAAQFSGVGTEALNQILPLAAAILAGGMTKAMAAQGTLLNPMAEAWRNAASGQASAGPTGMGAWADMWQTWMTPPAPPQDQPAPSRSTGQNPFEEMMASFMRPAAVAKPVPAPEPKPEPRAKPEPEPKQPAAADPVEAWGQMMETGREMQQQHLASLQSIFDSFWGGGTPSTPTHRKKR